MWPFSKPAANGHAPAEPIAPLPPPPVVVPPPTPRPEAGSCPVPSRPDAPPPTTTPPRSALRTHKLSRTGQRRVCELLGQYRELSEIVEVLQAEEGVTLSTESVRLYRRAPKWRPLIERARLTFLTEVSAIPIAQKTVRVARCEGLYHKAMARGQYDQARLALQAAREEMDGVGDTNIYIHQQILHMDTAALEARRRDIAGKLSALEVSHALEQA